MPSKKKQPQIPLPKSWDKYVKSSILHVFARKQVDVNGRRLVHLQGLILGLAAGR